MVSKKRLLGISELYNTKTVVKMSDNRLEDYINDLKSFVEIFPVKEAEIKNVFEAKDYLSFSECFASIREILIRIHADDLAQECHKLIDGLAGTKHEKLEAHMTYLLSLLTMLSIDIQMAVYQENDDEHCASDDSSQELANSMNKTEDEYEAVLETLKTGDILAVDDNSFFLDNLKTALQGTGYKLICVTSGIAALKYLEKNEPDLFILDIEMPEMNGYDLAQKIRELEFKAPILFLTGNATKEYVSKAVRMGAADFIVKPITQKQVLERIGKFI